AYNKHIKEEIEYFNFKGVCEMETDDLLNRAKSGDNQALIDWSLRVKPMIARLAFQSGMPIEDIGKFHHAVVKDIGTDLEAIEDSNAENKLLESAVRILKTGQMEAGTNPADDSLKFEEDLE